MAVTNISVILIATDNILRCIYTVLCVCEVVTFEETFLINYFNVLPSLDRLIKN